jgi:bifunctional UDP-N-acetylglucosamine pyrophosphorylase/glucosamine-1-phosphate N-acetyltransferase
MGSDLPKVLLPLCGRPMLAHILDVISELGVARPVIVVGKNGDLVRETLGGAYRYTCQEEQLGSGHAVLCARETALGSKNVLIMCGDSPLFKVETVRSLMETHVRKQATITLASAILDDPRGYGRILRAPTGNIMGIVEEKPATPKQKAIKEINGGCYAFDAEWLWENIELMHANETGEYCLTEMVDIAIAQGKKVITVSAEADEVAGVNTPDQLLAAENILRARAG